MTREEAIIILDCERPYGNCGCGASDEEIEDALNMAIKALEQEPSIDELRAEITALQNRCYALTKGVMCGFCNYECQYKAESEKEK